MEKKIIILSAIFTVIIFCVGVAVELGILKIEDAKIAVQIEYSDYSINIQKIVDKNAVAVMVEADDGTFVIADHNTQEFKNLPNVEVGNEIVITKCKAEGLYEVTEIGFGWANEYGIRYKDQNIWRHGYKDADVILFTCTNKTGQRLVVIAKKKEVNNNEEDNKNNACCTDCTCHCRSER